MLSLTGWALGRWAKVQLKTIGVIGGLGPESSLSYYRVMNRVVRARRGGFHSCRLVLDSLDFHDFAAATTAEDFEGLRGQLVASGRRLEAAGADFLVIACNTVHRFAQSVGDSVGIPLLHIADATGAAVVRDGHHRVALLGTRPTMESPFYKKRLAREFGLEVVLPSKERRDDLHRLILEELNGCSPPAAVRERLDEFVAEAAGQRATAVLLACTELGLAFGNIDDPVLRRTLPLYDTAIVHAQAAVEMALADG